MSLFNFFKKKQKVDPVEEFYICDLPKYDEVLMFFNMVKGKRVEHMFYGNTNIIQIEKRVYLDARDSDKLVSQQMGLARAAEILLYGLSEIGITALVDEATGYQYEREQDALQLILKTYISEELLPWQQRFPHEFYRQIFRLNGWDYTVQNLKSKPSVVGRWTNKYIYKKLPKGVLEELKKQTPKDERGRLTEHLHRRLTPDVGHPNLNNQIISVVTIMKLSKDWKDFDRKFNDIFGQTSLSFDVD